MYLFYIYGLPSLTFLTERIQFQQVPRICQTSSVRLRITDHAKALSPPNQTIRLPRRTASIKFDCEDRRFQFSINAK